MSSFDNGAMTLALLGFLCLLILIGGLFLLLISRTARRMVKAYAAEPERKPADWRNPRGRFRPLFYQYPERWVAIRSSNVEAVQEALRLQNTARCSWQEGLARAGDRAVFLTPPVMGWVLAIGPGIPDPADDIDECYHFLVQLSRRVGQVQFFSLHAAVGHHAWARLNGGEIERAYAWAGETLWNQGQPTRAELDLGLACLDYGQPMDALDGPADAVAANVEKIPALAGRWSINPAGIDERILEHGGGIAGESSPVRPG